MVRMADPCDERPAAVGRHHPVGATVDDQQRQRKPRRARLDPGDRRDDFGREPRRAVSVEEGIGEDGLHHDRIARQSGEVHAGAHGEPGPDPGEHPAQRHQRGGYADPSQRRRGGDHAPDAVRLVKRIVQHDQPAETVAEQEEGRPGLFGPHRFDEPPQVLPVLLPPLHVGPLPRRPSVAPEVVSMHREAMRQTVVDQGGIEPGVVAEAVDVEHGGLGSRPDGRQDWRKSDRPPAPANHPW